jgi:hypothetical protein
MTRDHADFFMASQHCLSTASDEFIPLSHQQQRRPPRRHILVAGGSEYRRVLDYYIGHFQPQRWIAADADITHTRGSIGLQCYQLREWLDQFNRASQAHHKETTP